MQIDKMGALFVDFENVFYSLASEPVSLTRDAALSATMHSLNNLRKRLRDDGYAMVVERSYADWEKMPESAQRQLQLAGVLPRFVDARIDKNSADIELSLDVLHYVLTRKELAHVVLVGGDRDYLPILRRVKEEHRSVIVSALRRSLSGDIREFVGNYSGAGILELDELVQLAEYPRQARTGSPAAPSSLRPSSPPSPAIAAPTGPTRPSTPASLRFDPNGEYALHEAYLQAMARFMRERRYPEIHLGPFFRWLTTAAVFPTESSIHLRRVFDELQGLGAVRVEERETGQGYGFSVAKLDYNHPLVQRSNDEE